MKKRLACLGIALSLLFGISVPTALAVAGDITATVSYNYDADQLVVMGTVKHERPGAILALKAMDANGTIVAVAQTKTFLNGEGKVAFRFSGITFPATLLSGNISVVISGQKVNTGATYTLEYNGADKQLILLSAINSAEESTFDSIFLPNAAELGADTSRYTKLPTDEAKSFMSGLLLAETYDLPSDFVGDDNQAKIKIEANRFLNDWRRALAITDFSVLKTTDAFGTWYTENFVKYGMDQADVSAQVDIEKALPYFNQVRGSTAFLNRMTNAPVLSSISDIRDYIYESALLSVIETAHQSETRSMLETFMTVFEIDTNQMKKLSETKLGECYATFSGGTYSTYQKAGEFFNDLVASALKPSGGSSSGGGGGGGNRILISPIEEETKVEEAQKSIETATDFSDMDSALYAKDAVAHLAARGIVSGKGNGTFEPNSYVTRAEFIKMVISAVSAKTDESAVPNFADVDASAWYAPYVAAAQRSGIAYGNENNEFLPNAKITRQDMVVLLYRAMQTEDSVTEQASFTDGDEISAYALEAINYMFQKGYIHGIGDGQFGARLNATRAQAATILYNLMK